MGKRKGKGRAVKNTKHVLNNEESEELTRAPHSFIIHRGKLGKHAKELMVNFRKIMEPYTASQLKVQKRNALKDFVHIAGPLNVSHLIVFTKSEVGMYLRTIKLPRGPTLTFQIKEYSLSRDVISSQKKPLVYEQLFGHHPLLVLNQFSGEGMQLKLMTTMFQNMFPSININKVSLNKIRRCVLLNYNNVDKTIDLRHYAIKIVPTGMSKAVKKLVQSKVPNLGQYHDVSEFLLKSGNLSDSEAEIDTALNTVTLPQHISSRGNIASEKSAIRLFELGPRIKLQLIKIEEGIMSGEVLFHEFFTKTPEEVKIIKSRIEARKHLKAQRRLTQQKNVERKKKEMKEGKDGEEEEEEEDSAEEDMEWYEKEVGEKPDEDFTTGMKRKTNVGGFIRFAKKSKLPEDTKSASNSPKSFQDVLALRKKRKQAKEKKQQKKKKMHK